MPIYSLRKNSSILPTLYTENIDNPAGDLTLKRAGTTGILLESGYTTMTAHLRLSATRALYDTGFNLLLDPDDSGNITTLAPVTGSATLSGGIVSAANACSVEAKGPACVGMGSGGAMATGSVWRFTATGTLYINICSLIPRALVGGTIKITQIDIYINTSDNNAYISDHYLRKYLLTSNAMTVVDSSMSDTGNGSTGDATRTIGTDYTREAGYGLNLDVGITVTAGQLDFHGIKITFEVD